MDTEEGVEVVWNEVQFSEKRDFRAQQVSNSVHCFLDIQKKKNYWLQVLTTCINFSHSNANEFDIIIFKSCWILC